MRRNLKTALFGALCGAFLFAAAAPGSAGPLSTPIPLESFGSTSLVQKVARYSPPEGKQCIRWTRRYSSSHGFGRLRCVHWK